MTAKSVIKINITKKVECSRIKYVRNADEVNKIVTCGIWKMRTYEAEIWTEYQIIGFQIIRGEINNTINQVTSLPC